MRLNATDEKLVSQPAKVMIRKIPSGVRGLDDILGGGIPEFSFNIIAGSPGSGKTTMVHQIVFANATAQKPALFFTVLGEPAIKMLRYQQQYSFFDESKLGNAVRFFNLADVVLNQDLNAVYDEITKQVTAANPSVVVVDSFRTVVRKAVAARAKWKCNRSSSASPSFSPVGKPRRFWSANMSRKRSATIRCSPSPMVSSGFRRMWREIPWCENCKS
jgi:predicted ATP-dependent serine protease